MWWLPIAAMIASAFANKQAQDAVNSERQSKMNLERQRQSAIGEKVKARMEQELQNQARPQQEQQLEKDVQTREAAYAPAAGTGDYVASPSAPKEVRSDMAVRMVDALKRGRQQAGALAKLGARSDQAFDNNLALAHSAQDLNTFGGFSRGSSAVLPYELQGANGKGDSWRTVADVANAVAMGSMYYNMAGAGTPPPAGPEQQPYIDMHRGIR